MEHFARAAGQAPATRSYALDAIKRGLRNHLDDGGKLPTNWPGLTNSVNWKSVSGIFEYYQPPTPETSYTILACPVTNETTRGLLFLLASTPSRKSLLNWNQGRWAFVAWPEPLLKMYSVRRIWLPEDSINAEVRSQLAHQP